MSAPALLAAGPAASNRLATACLRVYDTFRTQETLLATLDRDLSVRAGAAARATQFSRLAASFCAIHDLSVSVVGPRPDRPAIWVANHRSYLDPLVLGALAPLIPIAKSEVGRWPVVGAAGDRMGVLWIRRGHAVSGASVLRRAARVLGEGVSVLNFPEGTTSRDVSGPFAPGLFYLAQKLDLPVIPIRLEFSDPGLDWIGDATFLPHYFSFLLRARTEARVLFGAPLRAAPGESAPLLAERARQAIIAL